MRGTTVSGQTFVRESDLKEIARKRKKNADIFYLS